MRVAADAVSVAQAADLALAQVRRCDGTGGLIVVDSDGEVALPFTSAAMNRGVWREGAEPQAWV
jgi:isoaspartyl peptidase/L-asparaginase-like protein (Ntn-hydrolase superfamily)